MMPRVAFVDQISAPSVVHHFQPEGEDGFPGWACQTQEKRPFELTYKLIDNEDQLNEAQPDSLLLSSIQTHRLK